MHMHKGKFLSFQVDNLEFLREMRINPIKVAKALVEVFAEMILMNMGARYLEQQQFSVFECCEVLKSGLSVVSSYNVCCSNVLDVTMGMTYVDRFDDAMAQRADGWTQAKEVNMVVRRTRAVAMARSNGNDLFGDKDTRRLVLHMERDSTMTPTTRCCCATEPLMVHIHRSKDVNLDIAQELLRAADQYLLEGLKRLCEYAIAQELFKITSGHSLFGVVNGRCVDDPRSKASDLNVYSLSGLDIATNRDIIGIALANLIVC
ncbi:ARM REPEAT PROTEIN INTERACTING WITH ABF2 [Camellia lanceoleosa]|uniref:ARM REPEAT PROTEIN INTERACTING WITH ABF2 n=1 Tax=Camellia lanceoleosa TaxID=1840588 RepID=A0ACC0HAG6_9ERIC|nr:ARM REPEAT PROTEIN INTERACTING WITH ABF2 [Camellia lanceoleosa]